MKKKLKSLGTVAVSRLVRCSSFLWDGILERRQESTNIIGKFVIGFGLMGILQRPCAALLVGVVIMECSAQASPLLRGEEALEALGSNRHLVDTINNESILRCSCLIAITGQNLQGGQLSSDNSKEVVPGPPSLGGNLRNPPEVESQERADNPTKRGNAEKPNRVRWYLTPIGLLGIAHVILSWAVPVAMGYLIAMSSNSSTNETSPSVDAKEK